MTDPRNDDAKATEPQPADAVLESNDLKLEGTLELREERPVVQKEREVVGAVNVSREVRRETVQVPVELVTEVLVIEHTAGNHAVTLDGTPLAPGERREMLIYREEAQVHKQVVVSEQVSVSKRQAVETRTFDTTLAREELVVQEEGEIKFSGDLRGTRHGSER
ncbi:YsnF/AvaK domain-containing protein [Deinococcus aerophilus]|uniref:DUF2382 domain-containing protein n=1 Tax=Deinococcus aerophilus TaxID=522488 RepID=A0ABQ2GIL3_9DEIO|nr:YsnF/AvaK domain-containing protein [Deinococcus aerophilus]GGL97280.1 hypothetical protein GCM10010841_02030 [Deinococcus aerophilus]